MNEPKLEIHPSEEGAKKESETRISALCDMAIDTEAIRKMKIDLACNPYGFIEGKKTIPTRISTIRSSAFIGILEMAECIYEGLDWDKKGRIVVEYDPQNKKFEVATFQEASDLGIVPDREEVPRFLLRREDRKIPYPAQEDAHCSHNQQQQDQAGQTHDDIPHHQLST